MPPESFYLLLVTQVLLDKNLKAKSGKKKKKKTRDTVILLLHKSCTFFGEVVLARNAYYNTKVYEFEFDQRIDFTNNKNLISPPYSLRQAVSYQQCIVFLKIKREKKIQVGGNGATTLPACYLSMPGKKKKSTFNNGSTLADNEKIGIYLIS